MLLVVSAGLSHVACSSAGAPVLEPAASVEAENIGKDDVHPEASPVAASLPAPVSKASSPGAPAFPFASVAAVVTTVRVAVGGADRSVNSTANAMPGASSFLSEGLGLEVPQEVATPLSTADEALRCLWEALKEVRQAMDPGFMV